MIRKILIYASFIVASVMVVALFVTAKNYSQLALATVLYPFLVYFAFHYLPDEKPSVKTSLITVQKKCEDLKEEKGKEEVEIVDVDKRAFLKFVGAAGFTFFIFSLLTRKIEAFLLGGNGSLAPSPTSNNEDASSMSTSSYKISEVDNGLNTYYGFVNPGGAWYIMKEDPNSGSFRYTRGESTFPKNWANRENLKYDYFHNVFSEESAW